MTSTMERAPSGPTPQRRRRSRADVVATRPVAAVTAAVWAAGVGLLVLGVLVSLVWAVSGRGDDALTTPLRATGLVWLVAHQAPVQTPVGEVALVPLLLLALPLVLLVKAGSWAARVTSTTGVADAALLVVTAAATYAFVGWLVAQAAGIGDAAVSMASAVLATGVVGLLGLSLGVARGAGVLSPLLARVPLFLRRSAVAAAASGAALAAAAGVVMLVALGTRWSTVTGLWAHAAASPWDSVGLLLLTLAYLPNLLVWSLAYLAGPGFALGGATFNPFSASAGLLPGIPVLGAVPEEAAAAAPLLLLLPVLAGAVASVVLRRRSRLDLQDEALALLAAAGLVGAGTALLCHLAGGSLGSGTLSAVGPSPLAVGLAVAGLVAAGSLLCSLLVHAMPSIWVHERHG